MTFQNLFIVWPKTVVFFIKTFVLHVFLQLSNQFKGIYGIKTSDFCSRALKLPVLDFLIRIISLEKLRCGQRLCGSQLRPEIEIETAKTLILMIDYFLSLLRISWRVFRHEINCRKHSQKVTCIKLDRSLFLEIPLLFFLFKLKVSQLITLFVLVDLRIIKYLILQRFVHIWHSPLFNYLIRISLR